MAKMVYQWKERAVCNVDAQLAGEELERIRVLHNGRLAQEDVVKEAKAQDNPLHGAFEWNDKKAAHSWRLEQASYLIRNIVVQVNEDKDVAPIRAFVNVKRDDDQSYTSVHHAMSDAELRAQVVANAWKELEAWRKRHAELIEFARLFAVIDGQIAERQIA